MEGPSVRPSIRHTFRFPFCQRLWDLTKRQDDIVVADIVADMVVDMEVHMLADMEVDKEADWAADKNKKKKRQTWSWTSTSINMEVQFGKRVGQGGWLIGSKLFWPNLRVSYKAPKGLLTLRNLKAKMFRIKI